MSKNPKKLLENCRIASEQAVKKERKRVQAADLKVLK